MKVQKVRLNDTQAPEAFFRSLKETGFAILEEHSVPADLIDRTYGEWKAFFASEEKHDYRFDPAVQAGFFPFGSEHAKGSTEDDLKEFFHYYPKYDLPPLCQQVTPQLYESLLGLASTLLTWIENGLPSQVREGLSESLSSMAHGSEKSKLRPIHYPPLKGSEPEGAIRAAAHEDINLITLLVAGTEPGLQVQDKAGDWHDVSCDPGSIAVNVGDMLQEATAHYMPSTTHRVVNPQDPQQAQKPRYSIPLFLHARPEVKLSDRYTAKSYLDERIRELGLK